MQLGLQRARADRLRIAGLPRANPLPHFVRREGSVLIVPAIPRTVGGGHVELHEMDVLADRIGRRGDLKIVARQIARRLVGVTEFDALSRDCLLYTSRCV